MAKKEKKGDSCVANGNLNVKGGGDVAAEGNNVTSHNSVNIGGDVSGSAIVMGNNNVANVGNTATTTNTNIGFQQQSDKDNFSAEVEHLKAALREIKRLVALAVVEEISIDDKDDLDAALSANVLELKAVQESAAQLDVGEQSSQGVLDSVENGLEKARTLFERVNRLGEKVASLTGKITPIVRNTVPILLSARKLFGLP